MPDKSTLWLAVVAFVLIGILVLGIAWSGSDGESPFEPKQQAFSGDTPPSELATPTLAGSQDQFALSGEGTPPLSSSSVYPGATCDDGNCMWSKACVDGRYTVAEQDGMTRVIPNSCIPIRSDLWFIRPEDPFAGMPCSKETYGQCVWSRLCVANVGLPPEKNGLARVVPGSCAVVP